MNCQGVFLICWLVVLGVYAEARKTQQYSRIVNGHGIDINKAPFAVQLRSRDGYFVCSGSLVTPQHVISAAHCIIKYAPRNIIVAAGATYKDVRGEERNVIEHYLPAGYDIKNPSSNEDIIVFKLDKPMPINDNIQTIKFCDSPLTPGEMAKVIGWGATYARAAYNYALNAVEVPIIDRAKCSELYKDFAPVHGSMFCAGNLKTHQDACTGDSGGPLVIREKLCGVVSWGRGCARPDSPGVYTSIKSMISFINKSIH